MVQHGEQRTLHSEPRPATGPETAANSLKKTVLSASRQGRNVVFASFFFAVIIQEASPNPSLQHHLQSFRSSIASAQRQTGLGAKESSNPCTESSPGGSQIWWVFCLPFPRGRLRRGCKNLGARSLACQEANCLHILQEQHPCVSGRVFTACSSPRFVSADGAQRLCHVPQPLREISKVTGL